MSADRFHLEDVNLSDNPPGVLRLNEPESHHAARVLRKGVGDEIEVFDGAGYAAAAVIVEISRRHVSVELMASPRFAAGAVALTLAVCVPKSDRFRWLIEKATELGVDAVQPLETERSVVSPRESKLDKLRQTSLAACKQCGRNKLMTIHEPASLAELLEEFDPQQSLFVGDPAGSGVHAVDLLLPATVFIGPEGGFTTSERELLDQHRAISLRLGLNTLRTETAAVTAAALLIGTMR